MGCHGPSREEESGHPDTFSDTLSFPFFTANRKHSSTSALFLLPPLLFFVVCADCDEIYDIEVDKRAGGDMTTSDYM